MKIPPAIAVLEFGSIAHGTQVADAMIKRAAVDVFHVGTVHPGKYIILVGGSVGEVKESHHEGMRLAGDTLNDAIFLPDVHRDVYESIDGVRRPEPSDALGVIECESIPSTIRAADRSIKTAKVNIMEIRLGDGLGGKGLVHLTGTVEDVQAAIEGGVATIPDSFLSTHSVVIPAQHGDLAGRISDSTRYFGSITNRRG